MNTNYFYLTLDTTSPNITIVSPQYTTFDIMTPILIESNETLMQFQNIYIIDSKGKKHILNCLYQGNSFYGEFILNNLSAGIATIYCQLKDEVGNTTSLISKTINIYASQELSILIEEQSFTTEIILVYNKVDLNYFKDICIIEVIDSSCFIVPIEAKVKLDL